MQFPDTPRDDDQALTAEQRRIVLIDAIRQTQAATATEEEAHAIIDNLGEVERWYVKAFATLSKTRASEPRLAPISLEEMTAYVETQDIPVAPDEFIEVIQAIDSAWMDIKASQ